MEVVTCGKIPVIDFNGLNKKKKNGSGKTFYIQSYDQIEHLVNIFDEYLGTKWRKGIETPATTADVFSYFKYIIINFPDGKTRMDAIVQFPARKTVNSAKRLFADFFGIFKLFKVEKVVKPLIVPHLKLRILSGAKVSVEQEREWGQFSFGGASRSIVRTGARYLEALRMGDTTKHLPGLNELREYRNKIGNMYGLHV